MSVKPQNNTQSAIENDGSEYMPRRTLSSISDPRARVFIKAGLFIDRHPNLDIRELSLDEALEIADEVTER